MGVGAKDIRDKALLLIGFAAGFRRSELIGLDIEDIQFVTQGLVISVNRSKTDQTGQGRKVGIPFAEGMHCPVHSLKQWIGFIGADSGPIFRPISRHEFISPKRLTGNAVASIVKERVRTIGLAPENYSGHSLRSGLATSAAFSGVPLLKIRQQTGHKSDSTLSRYVRNAELFIGNAVSTLL